MGFHLRVVKVRFSPVALDLLPRHFGHGLEVGGLRRLAWGSVQISHLRQEATRADQLREQPVTKKFHVVVRRPDGRQDRNSNNGHAICRR
jgi:hypothetical protein